MKIQQHDGVVVEATVISAGLRQAQGEGGVSQEGEGGARCWGTLQKTKNFLWFHQDPSMSSSSNE